MARRPLLRVQVISDVVTSTGCWPRPGEIVRDPRGSGAFLVLCEIERQVRSGALGHPVKKPRALWSLRKSDYGD